MVWGRLAGGSLLDRRSRGEGLFQECAAKMKAFGVDAVADALRHVPFHGEPRLRQLLAGDEHGVERDELVAVAVHQQNCRRRARVLPNARPT